MQMDTSTPAPKGAIRAASSYRYLLSAAGDNNYGYFYGGEPGPRSFVDRLDYSNDTATAVQKGNLPENSSAMGSAANSTHAYGIGGRAPSVSSRVTRIDYSNDTAAPSPKGPLSAVNYSGAAASGLSNAQYQFTESILAPVQPPFPYPQQLPVQVNVNGVFDAFLYTGNGLATSSNRAIDVGIDFATNGGMVWIKNRSENYGSCYARYGKRCWINETFSK